MQHSVTLERDGVLGSMQIFSVEEHPEAVALALCDQHIVSQVKESAQILSAAAHLKGLWAPWMCRPAYLKHPVVLWTASHPSNFSWTALLGSALSLEYSFRFPPKKHKFAFMFTKFLSCGSSDPRDHSPFVQVFAQEHRNSSDPIEGHRAYYRTKLFARWNKGRTPPSWWKSA